MADRQKKGEGQEYKKSEYLKNKKSFWRALIWLKNKNLMKIVDTTFKDEHIIMSQAANKEIGFSSQQLFQLIQCLMSHRFHCIKT